MVEVVIVGNGKSMEEFELGRAPSFQCRVLTSWARKTPRNICQFVLRITSSFWIHILGAVGHLAHHRSVFSIRGEALGQLSSSYAYPSHSASVFPWRDCDCCVVALS